MSQSPVNVYANKKVSINVMYSTYIQGIEAIPLILEDIFRMVRLVRIE